MTDYGRSSVWTAIVQIVDGVKTSLAAAAGTSRHAASATLTVDVDGRTLTVAGRKIGGSGAMPDLDAVVTRDAAFDGQMAWVGYGWRDGADAFARMWKLEATEAS